MCVSCRCLAVAIRQATAAPGARDNIVRGAGPRPVRIIKSSQVKGASRLASADRASSASALAPGLKSPILWHLTRNAHGAGPAHGAIGLCV